MKSKIQIHYCHTYLSLYANPNHYMHCKCAF